MPVLCSATKEELLEAYPELRVNHACPLCETVQADAQVPVGVHPKRQAQVQVHPAREEMATVEMEAVKVVEQAVYFGTETNKENGERYVGFWRGEKKHGKGGIVKDGKVFVKGVWRNGVAVRVPVEGDIAELAWQLAQDICDDSHSDTVIHGLRCPRCLRIADALIANYLCDDDVRDHQWQLKSSSARDVCLSRKKAKTQESSKYDSSITTMEEEGRCTNDWMHCCLCVFTGGLWAPCWVISLCCCRNKKQTVVVKQ